MNRLRVLAFVLSACIPLQGCPTRVDWPKVLECAPSAGDLLGVVARILLGDGSSTDTQISWRAKRELEDLALVHGPGVVACVVKTIVTDWTDPGVSQHPDRVAAARRGKDFLSQTGVEH